MTRATDVARIEEHLTRITTRARSRQAALDPALSLVATAILRELAADPDARAVDLATRYGMDKSSISRQLAAMERDGLVVRGGRGGREGQTVSVTPAGTTLLQRATEVQRARLGRRVADWPAADVHTLATLLQRLAAAD